MPIYQKGDPMTLLVAATLTDGVPFNGAKFVGLSIGAEVTGTLLTLQVQDNSYPSTPTYSDVIGATGTAVTFVPVVGGRSVSLLAATAYVPKAGDRLRIKSGTTQATAPATIVPIFEV